MEHMGNKLVWEFNSPSKSRHVAQLLSAHHVYSLFSTYFEGENFRLRGAYREKVKGPS